MGMLAVMLMLSLAAAVEAEAMEAMEATKRRRCAAAGRGETVASAVQPPTPSYSPTVQGSKPGGRGIERIEQNRAGHERRLCRQRRAERGEGKEAPAAEATRSHSPLRSSALASCISSLAEAEQSPDESMPTTRPQPLTAPHQTASPSEEPHVRHQFQASVVNHVTNWSYQPDAMLCCILNGTMQPEQNSFGTPHPCTLTCSLRHTAAVCCICDNAAGWMYQPAPVPVPVPPFPLAFAATMYLFSQLHTLYRQAPKLLRPDCGTLPTDVRVNVADLSHRPQPEK
ncbi:hypothetical protein DM02DRAFT_625512 [Periconia macrospinosa]|uniref:Uncharacterized protein n=1 Tax=Periconia macrospinosa TaxID=97972 RepID=A0A2V1DZS2_9PLEO|nr:hypothetical protein DM02DRAFT_625512 [Periconia macrospinosa]